MAVIRSIKSILFTLTTGYLLLVVLVWSMQGCMVHVPSKHLVATPADAGLGYEDLTLITADNETLHAWYIPAPAARGDLLFMHGNAGNISHRLTSIGQFHRMGLNVLIVDYRGYGKSSGKPSEQGLYRDAEAAYRWLVEERGVVPGRIVVFGRSLGAAVAAHVAAEKPVGALILESGFTSVPDLGAEIYPFLPVRQLSRYQYDTREKLSRISVPVLVIHSPQDDIVPFHHGQALFDAAAEPKQFLQIQGDHNRGFVQSGELYTRGLAAFVDRWMGVQH
ncbi:alpha/beta hydrolase [Nitrincola alkalilacustris]|uniref:alpha/beta hydrolase n=1 Tax=Nitrincola alkalilacustris TaxID=1571224 RepID=UPI00124CB493|nr:alpha/beta hydrolase [Nitrincola alkalilacustris]